MLDYVKDCSWNLLAEFIRYQVCDKEWRISSPASSALVIDSNVPEQEDCEDKAKPHVPDLDFLQQIY